MICENPLVTIVIPVYNGANFLREAIDSAIDQTYSNIEIIVVNDGSTDDGKTEKIAQSYGEKIRYYSKKNGGVATALNYAIKRMRGEYFCWLSHDDIYYPEKIEIQMQYIKKSTSKIVFSDYDILRENGSRTPVRAGNCYTQQFLESGVLPIVNAMIQFGGVLLHKDIFMHYGMFNEQCMTTQDFEFLFRILKKEHIEYIPRILYAIRHHAEQGSRTIASVLTDADEMYAMFLDEIRSEECEEAYGSAYSYYYQMFLNIWPQEHLNKSLKKCIKYLSLEPEEERNEDAFEQFKGKRIYIFGAGNYGRRLLMDMQIREIHVEGFIDNNAAKKQVNGISCISAESALAMQSEILVIIATILVEEVEEQLRTMGFQNIMYKRDFDTLSIKNPPRKEKIIPTVLNDYFRVCIYCAGEYGLKTYFALKSSGIKVALFGDRDESKQGYVLDDVECVSYHQLQRMDKRNLFVFICIKEFELLQEFFRQAGFSYVYSIKDIEEMQKNGLINPYAQWDTVDYAQKDKLQKVNQFREDFVRVYYEGLDAVGEYDAGDSLEHDLLWILNNAGRRRNKVENTSGKLCGFNGEGF